MVNLTLHRMCHAVTCAFFMVVFSFSALPVRADATPRDKEKEWEKCYFAQLEKNGANACLNYCKAREGYTDVDLDDRLQACQEQQGYSYYMILARYNCGIIVYGFSKCGKTLESSRKRHAILDEQLGQWKSR